MTARKKPVKKIVLDKKFAAKKAVIPVKKSALPAKPALLGAKPAMPARPPARNAAALPGLRCAAQSSRSMELPQSLTGVCSCWILFRRNGHETL